MTKDEALKLAFDGLEALGKWYCLDEGPRTDEPWQVTALRKVCVAADKAMTEPDPKAYKPDLEPEQEPVATLDDLEQEIYENTRQFVSRDVMEWMLKRYYTTPPQRTWVGLTDEERLEAAEIDGADEWFWKVCKAIEAKLKEKNT